MAKSEEGPRGGHHGLPAKLMPPFYSQHGEDRLLADHFAGRTGGFFVEVGALDGVTFSNTCFFERALGWTGILVEANPAAAEKCVMQRPGSTVVQRAVVAPEMAGDVVDFDVVVGEEGLSSLAIKPRYRALIAELGAERSSALHISTIKVPTTTLDAILAQFAQRPIDLMSIDIEGHEFAALRGLSLNRWRPRVLLIESTTAWPEVRMVMWLLRSGYAYRRTIVINDWYEPTGILRRLVSIARLYLVRSPRGLRSIFRGLLASAGLLGTARRLRSVLTRRRNRPG